jgi:hypothetical protein
MIMSGWNGHIERISIGPSEAPLADSAERRRRLIAANDFKIRAMKQEAIKVGVGDDFVVLMLDLNDPLARQLYEGRPADAERYRIGQPVRPEDALQLAGVDYSSFREFFSPNHRNLFDRCPPSDIRVALMSEGRTMALLVPGDAKLDDVPPFIMIQTEEDRKAGTSIPTEFLPPQP